MTLPGGNYPAQWPSYLLSGADVAEVFDGETWRAVVLDGTTDPHFANIYLEGSPEGAGAEPIKAFVAEIAGQGNTNHISIWLDRLPPVRILDTAASPP